MIKLMLSWLFLLLVIHADLLPAATPLKNSVGMPEDLFRVVSNSQESSVNGGVFVKSLPAEFRRHYSIMIDTESNQPANPLQPRIIMTNAAGTVQVAVALGRPEHFEIQNFHENRFYHSELRANGGGVNLDERTCQRCHFNRP